MDIPSTPQSSERPTILIVDDQPANLAAMKEILATTDAELITAASGEEAISIANRRDLAVIFLDVNMPGMDGFETAEMLRMNKSTKHLALIMVTAHSHDDRSVFKGYASGAVDFLYKPVERGLLLSKAKVFIDLWRYRFELEKTKARLLTQNKELDDFVNALRQGKIETIAGEGAGAKVLRLLDKDIVEENERLLKDLARSNKDFQGFAHAAAHDMKAPLRHIKLLATWVLEDEGEKLSDEARKSQQGVCDAATRLSTMVDGLLTYAKVDAKQPAFKVVDLNCVVNHVVEDLAEVIKETGAQLDVASLPTVNGEESQIYQVFLNILGNALKYRRPDIGPVIKVSSCNFRDRRHGADRQTEEMSQVTVADNGVGFDESQVDRVFEPFQRLVTRREFEGSGIGLGTTKKIVERHGGTITAKSTPGKGSAFIVTLPMPRLSGSVSTASAPHLLLVGDDDPIDMEAVSRALDGPFRVSTASGAEQGLELLARENVDIVLSDYQMPGKNGIWLLSRMKERFPSVRRLLNSTVELRDLDEHVKSGVVEFFFPKPVEADQIQACLRDQNRQAARYDHTG